MAKLIKIFSEGLLLLTSLFFIIAWAEPALHDPTRPADSSVAAGSAPSGNTVELIYIAGDDRYAIIDGKYVKVGDTIDAYKVLSIERNAVLLQGDNGTVTLPLSEDIKNPHVSYDKGAQP